ncbi:MAG: cytochrome c maturation protein CcmE [Hyphomicrobiaceae bacterium]|nr:cytochrome c maturation protein CcmE [Hyphomicrobiaceae bacterium]
MTRKLQRAWLLIGGITVLVVATILVMVALRGSVVYFYAPSDLKAGLLTDGQRFRLGGLVASGSVVRGDKEFISFDLTDHLKSVRVYYNGILPDLFREGQGVIAEGVLTRAGRFDADTILAKHDENYMPPEVAESLKKKNINQ